MIFLLLFFGVILILWYGLKLMFLVMFWMYEGARRWILTRKTRSPDSPASKETTGLGQ